MEAVVVKFNGIPRPENTPSGLPNHWAFCVRRIPLDPTDNVLLVVNMHSGLSLQSRPAQILSLRSVSERARVLTPHLLKAFIGGFSRLGVGVPRITPWTWATEDPRLAKAVEDILKQIGVKDELCRVGECSQEEKDILEYAWYTPENIRMLFGPNWQKDIGARYQKTRLEILLDPPRFSKCQFIIDWMINDQALKRSPRPATDAEQQEIVKVRQMQETIRQRVGARMIPTISDTQAIQAGFGLYMTCFAETYMLALDTMDQGY
ncbi:hypothetical protein Daus18300_002138 [Diaporthe australafricana]|uniref:Uncharacterized protein n=1 Tax=Diaporthe australafricana TaxID=127596 RepID=A0ABR3XQG1_9PEZI